MDSSDFVVGDMDYLFFRFLILLVVLHAVIVRPNESSGPNIVVENVRIVGCIWVGVKFGIVNSDVFYWLLWLEWFEMNPAATFCFMCSNAADDM